MLMPRVLDQGPGLDRRPRTGEQTTTRHLRLSAVVTREGRLVNLELHPEGGQTPAAGSSEARAVQSMLGAMAQARFEPARVAGLPIAVNMVWLVTHTTVRGTTSRSSAGRSCREEAARRLIRSPAGRRKVAVV